MDNLAGEPGEVKIYTTPWCPFCINAKRLLDDKGVLYEDIDVSGAPDTRRQLEELTGSRTVPQIFVHGQSVGGCDELYALEYRGSLDALLASGTLN